MITTTKLGKELGRTPMTIRSHAARLGVGTMLEVGPNGILVFTDDEAEQIRQSVATAHAGRPPWKHLKVEQ